MDVMKMSDLLEIILITRITMIASEFLFNNDALDNYDTALSIESRHTHPWG
jgi:hypothetical protein